MNTNFDKQRFGKCLKYRLTDRFMILYSILALVACLPMMGVVFATGATSFPLLMSCIYMLLFGMVLAANKHFETLVPATAFEKFASYCTALVIYITAILAVVGSATLVLAAAGMQHNPDFPTIRFGYALGAIFASMPIGIIVGNLRRINSQSAGLATLPSMIVGIALFYLTWRFCSLGVLLAMAALGIVLWYLAYRSYSRREVC